MQFIYHLKILKRKQEEASGEDREHIMAIPNDLSSIILNQRTENAPKPKTVAEFWSHIIAKGGPSKPCRFLVSISRPKFSENPARLKYASDFNKLNDLIFQCETAHLPPRNISTYETLLSGPTIKLPYQTAYADLPLSFIVTNDMYEKRIFDSWMSYINDDTDFLFSYRNDYESEINIYQYDEGANGRANCTYSAKFLEAYPIAISEMPLTWGDGNFHKLQIVFTYTKWISSLGDTLSNLNSIQNLNFSGFGTTLSSF